MVLIMMYPYMTVNCLGCLEVCHSEVKSNGSVLVHFELPDSEFGFKEADIELPSYKLRRNGGFTNEELVTLNELCKDNAHLILKYARTGGIANA